MTEDNQAGVIALPPAPERLTSNESGQAPTQNLREHFASCVSPSCWCWDDDGFREGVTY